MNNVEDSGSIIVRTDIPYRSESGALLVGDLYRPSQDGAPVLIAMHGGGWRRGDRKSYRYWGNHLAKNGYALFAIQYRLAKGAKAFPEALDDVRMAVAFVRAHARALGVDPERIGVIGDSSGAHLAALAALTPREITIDGLKTSSKVKLAACVYGLYDLAAYWTFSLSSSPLEDLTKNFLGAPLIDDRQLYFEASPISHVTTKNAGTEFFLAYGMEDTAVDPKSQTIAFEQALNQAGFYVRSISVPGAGHYWMSDPIDDPRGYTGLLAPFLLRFLSARF